MSHASAIVRKALVKRVNGPMSIIDTEVANQNEVSLRILQNGAQIRSKLAARFSKKAAVSPSRRAIEDRDIFREIQGSLQRGAHVLMANRREAGVIYRSKPVLEKEWTSIAIKDGQAKRAQPHALLKPIWVPHWDHTGDMLKGLAWSMAIANRNGRALTLRLGPDVIEAGKGHSQGLARYLRSRVQCYLRRALAPFGLPTPEFFFAVEDTEFGETHIHGAIEFPEDRNAQKAVKAALCKAGGKWRSVRTGRQLDIPDLRTPIRWINYVAKWHLGTAARIGGSVFAATAGIRGAARKWYETARTTGEAIDPEGSYHHTFRCLLEEHTRNEIAVDP